MLAGAREAPARLLEISRRGVPVAAILSSTVIGYLCVVAAYVSPDTVFLFLLNSSGAIILFVYLLIGISQLVLRPKIPPEQLKVKMWFYPVLTLLTIARHGRGADLDGRARGHPVATVPQPAALGVVLAAYWFSRRRSREPFAGRAGAVMALHAVGHRGWMRARCRFRPRASSSSPTRPWVRTSCWASCVG